MILKDIRMEMPSKIGFKIFYIQEQVIYEEKTAYTIFNPNVDFYFSDVVLIR